MSETVLLLCLVPAGTGRPDGARSHRRVPAGPFDAVAVDVAPSMLLDDDPKAMLDLAMLQNDILTAYAAGGDVLPVALGAAFSNDRSLRRHLDADQGRLAQLTHRLEGRAEYILALELEPETAVRPINVTGGADFLQARKALRDDRRTLAERRSTMVAEVTRCALAKAEDHVLHGAAKGRLLSVSLLLRRDATADLARAMSGLASQCADLGLALRVIGPCAPMSFAGEEGTDAAIRA